MKTPLLLMAAVLALGLIYVVLPLVLDTYRRYRNSKVLTCPETHGPAEVRLNAGRAALMSALGKARLRVQGCTQWPKKQGCDERCVSDNWPSP